MSRTASQSISLVPARRMISREATLAPKARRPPTMMPAPRRAVWRDMRTSLGDGACRLDSRGLHRRQALTEEPRGYPHEGVHRARRRDAMPGVVVGPRTGSESVEQVLDG